MFSSAISAEGKPVERNPDRTTKAYPTENAIAAKERKKAGKAVVKRKKFVEDHYDDLGDDLSGLG